jgi:hypothetical protein
MRGASETCQSCGMVRAMESTGADLGNATVTAVR